MKNPLMAALVAALSLASHSANAQEYAGQRYLGFSIGQAESPTNFCDGDATFIAWKRNCPDKDTGIKLYVGHNLHKNFAVEAGFSNFGEFKPTMGIYALCLIDGGGETLCRGPADGTFTAKISGNSLFVAGMWKIQVHPKATLFGKVGLHRWDIEGEWELDVLYGDFDDDGVDLLYGIGGAFALFPNEKIKLRMEYETFTVDDFINGGNDFDFEFISIGIVYAF